MGVYYCLFIIMICQVKALRVSNTMRMWKFNECRTSSALSMSSWSLPEYMKEMGAKKARLMKNVDIKARPYTYTAVSFFHFVDKRKLVIEEAKVKEITRSMKDTLEDLGVRGTFLISDEGYNAQMAIPTALLDDTYESIVRVDESLFSGLDWNVGKTMAYHPDEFLSEYERQQKEKLERYKKKDVDVDADEKVFAKLARGFPFKKLIVKPKFAVLTDRLEGGEDLDWTDAGPELEPADWHKELSSGEKPPLLLDCRNLYESEMGTFEGSIPLNTDKFSESWKKLDELLDDVPKDQRVLTFCTGGIRCVKVNAYLKQKLGLNNIGRLKKGIIGYEQWLEEEKQEQDEEEEGNDVEMVNPASRNLFTGTNFLFDRRRLSSESASAQQESAEQ